MQMVATRGSLLRRITMNKILDTIPIIMLGIGQMMLAIVCVNQTKRINQLKDESLQNLALLFCTRRELNLPMIPEMLEHEGEDGHGTEE